jgi:hypothetical protein
MLWLARGLGKKRIECLIGPQGLESGNKEILRVDAGLYKSLFRKEDRGAFSFCSNF